MTQAITVCTVLLCAVSAEAVPSLPDLAAATKTAVEKAEAADPSEVDRWKRVRRVVGGALDDASARGISPCETHVFSGVTEVREDLVLVCKKVVFRDGAVVRLQGALVLAADEIRIEGLATIEGDGMPGEVGPRGVDRSEEVVRDIAKADCTDKAGIQGSDGKNGGDGAIVVFSNEPQGGALSVSVRGGSGGAGGVGGKGVTFRGSCATCIRPCDSGLSGAPGRRGLDGAVLVLVQVPVVPALTVPIVVQQTGLLSGPVCANGYEGTVRVTVNPNGVVVGFLDGGNGCISDTIRARSTVRIVAVDGSVIGQMELGTDVPGKGWPWNGSPRRGDSRELRLAAGKAIGAIEFDLRNDGFGGPVFRSAQAVNLSIAP